MPHVAVIPAARPLALTRRSKPMPRQKPSDLPPIARARRPDDIHDWLQSPEAEEFLSAQTRRDKKTGCLIWTGKTQKRFPYGYFYRKSKIVYAHRAAYIAKHGPIPKGLVVCHRCDNPSCIANEHLILGTQQDNLAAMWRKGRARWRSWRTRAHVVEINERLPARRRRGPHRCWRRSTREILVA